VWITAWLLASIDAGDLIGRANIIYSDTLEIDGHPHSPVSSARE
jgi:hypothetical protein